MYRAASPIFDVHDFPSLRHVKPLPKRRRTSSGSQSDIDVGSSDLTSTTTHIPASTGINGHPYNLTHLANHSHHPSNASSGMNATNLAGVPQPLSSYHLPPMSASDAAATAAVAEELLAQAAGSIMTRSALQHLQNFMPELWNAALAAATAGIGATTAAAAATSRGVNSNAAFARQGSGMRSRSQQDVDYAGAGAGGSTMNDNGGALVDQIEEALDMVNRAHDTVSDEDEVGEDHHHHDDDDDDGNGYNTDHHLHQHYGHGNTKKRKVPANSSVMRHHHHRGDEDDDEDVVEEEGGLEGVVGTVSNGGGGGRLGELHPGYSASSGAAASPASGVGSGGGPGSPAVTTVAAPSQVALSQSPGHTYLQSNHHRSHTPLSRRAKITAATLAGLQHKEMLKSRKRQLAAVLGALSLGDTLALDQALSASYPLLLAPPASGRHTSSSSGSGVLDEYTQALGLSTTGAGTTTGSKKNIESLPHVRLSKRGNVRMMRKTKVLIIARRKELELVERQRREREEDEEAQRKAEQLRRKEQERKQTQTQAKQTGKKDKSKKGGKGNVSSQPPPQPTTQETSMAVQRYEPQLQVVQTVAFPETEFGFMWPSSTADRLIATKEEVAMLRHRFEAELARQAAKAAKLAATNKMIAAAAAAVPALSTAGTPKKMGPKGSIAHGDGAERRSAKRTNSNVTPQKMKKNASNGHQDDTSPTRSHAMVPPALSTNTSTGGGSAADLANALGQSTNGSGTKSRNKKKKRSALANASNPHHLRNYVPSRLPSSNSGGPGSLPWGGGHGGHTAGGGGGGAGMNGYWGMSYEKQQQWLQQQQRDWVSPLPLRFLLAEIPPPASSRNAGVTDEQGGGGKGQRKRGKKGANAGNAGAHVPPLLTNPMDEWICAFCEYDLFYGGESGFRRAVRSRKKILRRRRRARERAAAAAAGHFGGGSGSNNNGGGTRGTEATTTGSLDDEEEDEEFDRTGPDKMGSGDDGEEYDVGDEEEGDAYG